MTSKDLILFKDSFPTKQEAIEKLTDLLYQNGKISSKQDYLQAVMEREKVSATGLENGLAIPHGKSSSVKEAAFAIAKLERPIEDWESIDPANRVELVFLLAIPKAEEGSTHLKLLSALSTRLMDSQFLSALLKAKTPVQILELLGQSEKGESESFEYSQTVLAITACAAGIAHTYMAAEALEKAGHELGVRVITEKQGANGLENEHTAKLIREADAVIFATDIVPKGKERFNGKPYVQTRVAEPLKKAKEMITRALQAPDGIVTENSSDALQTKNQKQGIFAEMAQAILTGISYMIPVIVAGGLMTGIAKLGSMPFGLVKVISDPKYATSANELFVLLHYLDAFGALIFKFIYPIFGAFVAYAIADRVGLVSGLIGGVFAGGLHFVFWGNPNGIPSGFLGVLILGLSAGYISRFLNNKIHLSKNLQAMKPMLIIPAISVLSMFLLNFFIVDPVFGGLNSLLRHWIESSKGSGSVALASIIAAATAFDLGGPINKAAGAIAIGLAADHIYPLTARVLAIVIPPIGLGLATIIDKYVVGRRVFDENLRITGNTSILLGFIAISEGALPFMLRNPLIVIPINIIGAIIGSSLAVVLGAVQWYPLPAIWGWPLVEHLWAYLIGLAAGVLFIAFANILVRFTLMKRKGEL
jgi:PTS system fructose-specific IIC component